MHQQLAARARDVIARTLIQLGCTQIGFNDDVENHALILGFKHRGRRYNLTASAKGWAQKYLKDKPWTYARRKTRHDYEQDALRKGYIAINSILRDWIKGQAMAIECGILSFEAVFMPHMLMADGRRIIEHLAESNLLPPPEEAQALPHLETTALLDQGPEFQKLTCRVQSGCQRPAEKTFAPAETPPRYDAANRGARYDER